LSVSDETPFWHKLSFFIPSSRNFCYSPSPPVFVWHVCVSVALLSGSPFSSSSHHAIREWMHATGYNHKSQRVPPHPSIRWLQLVRLLSASSHKITENTDHANKMGIHSLTFSSHSLHPQPPHILTHIHTTHTHHALVTTIACKMSINAQSGKCHSHHRIHMHTNAHSHTHTITNNGTDRLQLVECMSPWPRMAESCYLIHRNRRKISAVNLKITSIASKQVRNVTAAAAAAGVLAVVVVVVSSSYLHPLFIPDEVHTVML
jgi:hypothetical protein